MTMRVLKVDSGPSLSGKSVLTYQVGVDEEGQIHIRILGNTGRGYFSKDWVAHQAINDLLTAKGEEGVSGSVLASLFTGTSANTAGFFLAILKHLGVLTGIEEKRHAYLYGGSEQWLEEMQALIASDVSLPEVPTDTPAPPTTKKGAKGKKPAGKGLTVD